MGRKNYLVEGVSATGKTSVAEELERRGHQVVHGDRALAYQGDPVTGEPTAGHSHDHHIWPVDRVRALAADPSEPATFFCGGSRNHAAFLDVFDEVFVLDVDPDTLVWRLDARPDEEWAGAPPDPEFVLQRQRSGQDTPPGVVIDATAPLEQVVEEILGLAGLERRRPG